MSQLLYLGVHKLRTFSVLFEQCLDLRFALDFEIDFGADFQKILEIVTEIDFGFGAVLEIALLRSSM